jgi:hypothetical protein
MRDKGGRRHCVSRSFRAEARQKAASAKEAAEFVRSVRDARPARHASRFSHNRSDPLSACPAVRGAYRLQAIPTFLRWHNPDQVQRDQGIPPYLSPCGRP